MTINLLVSWCSPICFASFAWGMIWHFRRIGKPSRAMLVTALAAATLASVQIGALLHRQIAFPLAAGVLYGASVILFWWAVWVTRRKLAACGQGAVSSEIVRSGPYRYIRHPFYTAYNLTWVAGAVATAWWPLAISAVTMAVLYERAAREEERGLLSSGLAREYEEYIHRTGRYLPRIGSERLRLAGQ